MVLDLDYPSENNLYGDVFVHTRVKEYKKYALVQVVSFFRAQPDYEYEGIKVVHAPSINDIFYIFNQFKPDSVFIHFYDRRLYPFIKNIEVPVIIWVHGYEALGWYRRLFNHSTYGLIRNAHNIILPNIKQMLGFRKVVEFSNKTKRIHFVFVSDWMRRTAESDALIKAKYYSLIPNPINIELFKYSSKIADNRKKILLIRSFGSRKYANDIAVDAILKLSKKSFFEDLQITIYGAGKLFKPLTEPLKQFANISLNEKFLPNHLIPQIHYHNGVFLCPTRQDAQGVSMCEAMSSGLVPITINCTAIPEFIQNKSNGLMGKNAAELADQIEYLYYNPEAFLGISKKASEFINAKCNISDIVKKEMAIISQ